LQLDKTHLITKVNSVEQTVTFLLSIEKCGLIGRFVGKCRKLIDIFRKSSMATHTQKQWVKMILGFVLVSQALIADYAYSQKQLDPRAIVKIPVNLNPRDSFSLPQKLPGLEAPEYDPVYLSDKETLRWMGKGVVFYRDIYEFEFSFVGGLRQAVVAVPDLSTGETANKNVWYLIYRIRDRGNTITYDKVKKNPEFEHLLSEIRYDRPIPSESKIFQPRFYLKGSVYDATQGEYVRVEYADQISPMVLRQIQRLHDPGLNLLDTYQMSQIPIPLAPTDADGGVWGVAIFKDVDPRIDFVSLQVDGLSNAFRINAEPGSPNIRKVLQLNFWRPGGIINDDRDPINYGIPLVDDPQEQIRIAERYQLPGPIFNCYQISESAGERLVLIAEVDAKFDLREFQTAYVPLLDQGKFPEAIKSALAESGLDVDQIENLEVEVPGQRWGFKIGEESYRIALEPQFWEPFLERNVPKIRFIKPLDYLWIYR